MYLYDSICGYNSCLEQSSAAHHRGPFTALGHTWRLRLTFPCFLVCT